MDWQAQFVMPVGNRLIPYLSAGSFEAVRAYEVSENRVRKSVVVREVVNHVYQFTECCEDLRFASSKPRASPNLVIAALDSMIDI